MYKQLLLTALVTLAACGDLVPGTLRAVQNLDPLTADPADIAVRLDLPDDVAIVPGSAMLSFGARKDDGMTTDQSFALDLHADVLSVAPQDHATLRALQAHIGDWKAVDPDGTKGSLSVYLEPCKTTDTVSDSARASVAIRLEQDGPFLPLVSDAPLVALVKDEAWDTMEQCASPALH